MDRLHTGAVSPEVAIAADVFDQFCAATTFKNILGLHRNMCEVLHLYPTNLPHFYPKLKAKLRSWKAQALWKRLDARIGHKCYARGKACPNNRVLIIGAGPCGLRAAIEAQLLGAKVVVVEKRDRITRNNVLHLWPFVIQDLRALGAKKFFGKFCAGSIDHISIRQLQCILLKVALLLGVELHEGVSFESLIPPSDSSAPDSMGWHAAVSPADHPVSQYEFDVLIGADGKRNTLDGFKRKEFRGKLAIAITANFINKRSEAEARVEEISGVAFIFNQKFFKDLYQETGIDLENIVYYKDDTHYFVMTAKKHSLIEKGVILEDLPDTARLLAPDNVDREALMEYAREAAEFSTEYQMPNMEFAVNHYGQPDVAMFDFTSMYAAENASRILEQHGHKLLMCLVGDSLLEPFWPTGSGCARGFLSSFDACWAIRSWGSNQHPLEVLAERESIYRLLAQTTPENLQRDCASYTLDPATRYPNLNRYIVLPAQVKSLFQTDDPSHIEIPNVPSLPNDKNNALETHKKRRRRDTQVHPDTLLHWLKRQVSLFDNVSVDNLTTSFKNGLAFCAIIHRYRPDLIDFTSLRPENAATNNQLAFDVLEREYGILPVMTGEEMAQSDVPDKLAMLTYLSQIYDTFRGEIPHVKHLKLDLPEIKKTDRLPLNAESVGKTRPGVTPIGTAQRISGRHKRHAELMSGTAGVATTGTERRRKRRSADKFGQSVEERQKRLEEIASNRNERMSRRKLHRKNATENFYKSIYMLQTNTKHDEDGPFEDYSIYLYRQTAPNFDDRVKNLEQKLLYPDRENHFPGGNRRGSHDEDFTGRIKNIEDKLKGSAAAVDKKPRDLLRAIGKIESSDWNIKEIEKKIQENKMGKSSSHEKERVPKWSREQFLARQTKMEKKAILDRQDSETAKYSEIDSSLKKLDQKLKEGTVLEPGARGNNKVAVMAEQFAKQPEPEAKVTVQRSTSKAALVLPKQGGSESCHFCGDRVYLMERLSAEGKFFHRGCFRCQYCGTALRLGSYAYDKEGVHGYKFYCSQHFGLQGNAKVSRSPPKYQERSKDHKNDIKSPDKSLGVAGLDLLDRGQTPERIDLVAGEKEEMDEDEWTDRNFGQSAAEADSDDSSDLSDSDSDDVYEEALEQGLEADFTEGTLRLADSWQRKYSARQDDDSGSEYDSGSDAFSYYDYSSEDDASDTATEGEDDIRARELRQQEVRVQAPVMVPDTDTGSDTEVGSEDTDSSSEAQNSATEISTDSEFEHDGNNTPTQEVPAILLNDANVTKTRGNYHRKNDIGIKRVQVKSGVLSKPVNGNFHQQKTRAPSKDGSGDIKLEFTPLVPDITIVAPSKQPQPLLNPRKGDYLLSRTRSTEGIASKMSLELKKRYLLGNTGLSSNVKKCGSASALDSKFKSFHSNISEHQKLLNPAAQISPSMQAFLEGTSKLRAPLSPTQIGAPKTILTDSKNDFKHVCGLSSLEIDEEKQSAIVKDSDTILKSPEIIDSSKIPDSLPSVQPDVTRVELSKQTDDTKENMSPRTNETPQDEFVFEADCRPRSPVHETSIIVPNISWNNLKKSSRTDGTDVESDSLSSSSSENISMEYQALSRSSSAANMKVPRLEVHDTSAELGDIVLDSLNVSVDDVKAGGTEINHRIGSISIPDDPKSVSSTRTSSVTDTTVKSNVRSQPSSLPDTPKSLLSDPKTLNQPKTLANLETGTCETIHQKPGEIINDEQTLFSEHSSTSGSCPDITAAVLTETELSDWARDGNVSDNIEDMEYKIDPDYKTVKRNKKTKSLKRPKKDTENGSHANARIAKLEDFDDIGHVCGKEREMTPTKTPGLSPKIIKHFTDLDSIEFMDTGSEESCLDNINSATNTALLKNRGYVQFVNVQNSYARPLSTTSSGSNKNSSIETKKSDFITEPPVEAINTSFENKQHSAVNTGYCIFDNVLNRSNNFGSEVIDLKPQDLKRMQEKREGASETEQDSLLIIESEEPLPEMKQNTLQDEQANYEPIPTEKIVPKDDKNGNEQVTKKEKKSGSPVKPVDENNCTDYQEHVRRLQQKLAEFSNVRDSIDIRKSKRKSKPAFPGKSEDIIEEKPSLKNEETRKLEEITKEREKRKDLIHEMVMDKLNAQKKLSGGKKTRRSRNTFSPMTGTDSTPEKSIDIPKIDRKDMKVEELNTQNSSSVKENKPSNANVTPDILKINTNRNVILQKSPTESEISYRSSQPERRHSIHQSDYLNNPNATPTTTANRLSPKRLLTVHSSFKIKPESDCLPSTVDAVLLPDVRKTCNDDTFRTPQMKKKIEEAKKTTEKLREDARLRAQMKSDEDLGISPEDKIKMHRLKANKRYGADSCTSGIQSISVETLNTNCIDPKKKSMMLSTDSLYKHKTDLMSKQKRGELFRRSTSINEKLLSAKSNVDVSDKDSPKTKLATNNGMKPVRTKSVGEISKRNLSILDGTQGLEIRKSQSGNIAHCKPKTDTKVFHKSESSLLAESKTDKKSKCKDKERRKSIIQAVSGFFHKRKESSPTSNQTKSQNTSPNTSSDGFRDRLSRFRFSTKAKEKSKDKQFNESVLPTKSRSESCVVPAHREITPPPIPPPPLNYSGRESATLEDSLSEDEVEWKALDHSIETLDQAESSADTLDRKQRSMLRAARQSQQKRLRLAQEIQRKLEETEVKTRELEQIGVEVEKALRGEGSSTYSSRDESALLSEWLMLMRELAELRRYERELLDRAEELRLEERHARLQAQLQARLATDDNSKSSADVAAEGALLDEMLDIVSKRKSLIAQLEVDRQRYEEEDRDLEAQILSKGLRLTPFQKTPEK